MKHTFKVGDRVRWNKSTLVFVIESIYDDALWIRTDGQNLPYSVWSREVESAVETVTIEIPKALARRINNSGIRDISTNDKPYFGGRNGTVGDLIMACRKGLDANG